MVNPSEVLLNAVMFVELKMLTSSGQKASGPEEGFNGPLPQMPRHRRRGTTSPAPVQTENVANP
jgi:hypothetical protein